MQNDECRMQNEEKDFRGRHITVLGLGNFGGGIAVSRWLIEHGARVLVSDQSPAEKLKDSIAALDGLPIEFRLGSEQRDEDFTKADLIVASPAIPPKNPYLQMAKTAGVPITTEICLFVQRCAARVIGVTGTKGKSTASTLLHRMLAARRTTWFGGNIGKSLLAELPNIKPDDLVVLELSSYMLEHLSAIEWSPQAAVVTMISADHLDWHGSEEKYVDAKRNIVRFQKPADVAVLNFDNPAARSFAKNTLAKVIPFGMTTHPAFSLKLAGEHNQLNAQAAFTAASIFGIDWSTAQGAIADFAGLTHRLQLVHEKDGVKFINDSISTIPEAAIAALRSFPEKKVIQIIGGSGKKDLPVDLLCEELTQRAKVVLCIGETGSRLASYLPATLAHDCGTLAVAVERAQSLATEGDIILLSPGHPSYDQFTNFESRGTEFARLVKADMPGSSA
jgi:UDP-N-acetylmuramoylalanine--D-glutamate ligase